MIGPRVVSAVLLDVGVVVGARDFSPIGAHEHPASRGYLPMLFFPGNQMFLGEQEILIFRHFFAAVYDASRSNEVFGWYLVNGVVG